VDSESIMQDQAPDLNQRIAERVRELRAAHGLSLDALAARSGVSRSMISLIERGESSPTAVVLDRLATGLGVLLASLFDEPDACVRAPSGPVARRNDQPQWRDPASGYVRRNVSPPGVPQAIQIVQIRFPARARVAFETGARDPRVHQQVWVLEGSIDVTRERSGIACAKATAWPCSSTARRCSTTMTRKAARYAVVIASEAGARR
jgi:transcriptional regulator with XRE-family HTH domain